MQKSPWAVSKQTCFTAEEHHDNSLKFSLHFENDSRDWMSVFQGEISKYQQWIDIIRDLFDLVLNILEISDGKESFEE